MLTPKGYISCKGTFPDGYGEKFFKLPCQSGDTLYIRETWSFTSCIECMAEDCCEKIPTPYEDKFMISEGCYIYKAGFPEYGHPERITWRPSIHMPKVAARIWIKVTDVRVERLQDITEKQAESEGAIDNRGFIHSPENEYANIHSAREHFTEIWDSTVKKNDLAVYGWNANPWVWVISFEKLLSFFSNNT